MIGQKLIYRLLIALLLVSATTAFLGFGGVGPAMVVSVSSDGRYVISSHRDQQIVLWDIEDREREVVATEANIYSAYFIRGRHVFLWQGLDNMVHVETVDGETLKRFKTFSTYGHVMTADLDHYFASDKNWNIYAGYGEDQEPVKHDGGTPDLLSGKLLNLTLAKNGRYFLSAGYGEEGYDRTPMSAKPPILNAEFSHYAGVVLWSVETLKPIVKLPGNLAKTYATISSDGQYVLSGSENTIGFVWSAPFDEPDFRLASLRFGTWLGSSNFNDEGLIPVPSDFDSGPILSLQFINGSQQYLRICTGAPYAILYNIDDPLPVKYLPLGRAPYPSVDSYARNAAIDTAPAAGILVTGQRDGGGINVYRYDKDTQTLEKIWAPD